MSTVKVTKATQAYDKDAHKKPWMAAVTLDPFNQYKGPDFDHEARGAFSSAGDEGAAGELTIEIEAGNCVAFGQASKQEGVRGSTTLAIVQGDGTLQEVDRKALTEHLVARRAAGHITPSETCRGSATAAAAMRNLNLTPAQVAPEGPEGVLAQKAALSEAGKARAAARKADAAPADPAPGV